MNEYKGFCLFNDIEDVALRNRNRAVVLSNLANDHINKRKITPKGASLILGYFQQVPEEDREEVKTLFAQRLKEAGHVIGS